MRRHVFLLSFVSVVATGTALGDRSDPAGGVFIAHYAAAMEYSNTPPSEGWCQKYQSHHAIHSCAEQVTRIDTTAPAMWFVLAAWDEDKEWCGAEFGLGEYSTDGYMITNHGPCFPSQGLEIPMPGWPGPSEGTSLAITDSSWSGNYVPIYFFAGVAYVATVVPLAENPNTHFAGTAGCQNPPPSRPVTALGAMGMLTDGTPACPGELQQPLLGYGEFGVGVCCSEGRCAVVVTESCAHLPGEWTFHPEWHVCDPDPCLVYLTGDCEFPQEIQVAQGQVLRHVWYGSDGGDRTYFAGDAFVVDWRDGKMTIDGHPYVPLPEEEPELLPVETLREIYGAVPSVRHIVGESTDPVLWNRAVRLFDREVSNLERAVTRTYQRLLRQGRTPEAAAEEALAAMLASDLVDTASLDPSTGAEERVLRFTRRGEGIPGPVEIVLYEARPWSVENRYYISHRAACREMGMFRMLSQPHNGLHCIKISGGSIEFGGSCGEE
jgi:hypothetical protein